LHRQVYRAACAKKNVYIPYEGYKKRPGFSGPVGVLFFKLREGFYAFLA
jgi:hypothetical protein